MRVITILSTNFWQKKSEFPKYHKYFFIHVYTVYIINPDRLVIIVIMQHVLCVYTVLQPLEKELTHSLSFLN